MLFMEDLFIAKGIIYNIYCLTFLEMFSNYLPKFVKVYSNPVYIQYFGLRGTSYMPQDKQKIVLSLYL